MLKIRIGLFRKKQYTIDKNLNKNDEIIDEKEIEKILGFKVNPIIKKEFSPFEENIEPKKEEKWEPLDNIEQQKVLKKLK